MTMSAGGIAQIPQHLASSVPLDLPPPQDCCDYLAEWVRYPDGTSDFFDTLNHASRFLGMMSLSMQAQEVVQKVGAASNIAWSMLVWPDVITETNTLKHAFVQLYDAHQLPYNDPIRSQKIQQASIHAFRKGICFVNTSSDAAGVLYSFELVKGGPGASFFCNVYNLTSLISDSWDFKDQYEKREHIHDVMNDPQCSEPQRDYLYHKSNLALLKMIQDISSVAMAAIALICMVFGALIENTIFLPPLLFGLSVAYLLINIIYYFYSKIVENQWLITARTVQAPLLQV